MKKALVATILGIAASVATVASSYGQGAVFFDTYNAVGYFPVKWSASAAAAPGGRAGLAVTPGESFFANLLWTYGSTSGNANLAVATSGDIPGFGTGFIQGPIITTAANYVGGPITFTIQAWEGGTGYGVNNTANGTLTWTENAGIPFGGAPAGNFASLTGPVVVALTAVPEPTTFALAGLGAAAMLIFRRRNK